MDVFVVEGTHDEIRIKSVYPDAFCVITNGSEISKETLDYIKTLSKENNIIIFTDPDGPGEKIRSTIVSVVPNAKHAFIRKKDCISKNKKKVGVEHADKETIIAALETVYSPSSLEDTITMNELYNLGLAGSLDSAKIRDKISDKLNIGRPNAKSFLKRINMLRLKRKDIEDLICQVK